MEQISLRITNNYIVYTKYLFAVFLEAIQKRMEKGEDSAFFFCGVIVQPELSYRQVPLSDFLPSFSPTPVQSINHGWRGPRALDQRCFQFKKNLLLHVFEMPCSLWIFRRSKDLHPSGKANTTCQGCHAKVCHQRQL